MIKFTVDGNHVMVDCKGERLDVLAEAVMAFMTLAEGVAAYKKKEEFERGKKA